MDKETVLIMGVGAAALGGLLLLKGSGSGGGVVSGPQVDPNAIISAQLSAEAGRQQAGGQMLSTLATAWGVAEQNKTQLAIANLAATTEIAKYAHDSAVQIANAQTQYKIAEAQAQAQLGMAQAQAGAQKDSSFFGFLGDVIGGIFGGLF